jgi:hypothetical protein
MNHAYILQWANHFCLLCPEKQDKLLLISPPVLIQMLPKFNQFVFGQCPLVPEIFVLIRLIFLRYRGDRQTHTHTHSNADERITSWRR